MDKLSYKPIDNKPISNKRIGIHRSDRITTKNLCPKCKVGEKISTPFGVHCSNNCGWEVIV